MAYKHGVYNTEQATSLTVPIQGSAGLQVIFGTAPIHLAKDPAAAVNTPKLVYSYKEAVEAVGYSDDFENFTLCQSISACFQVFNVAPIILVNVLDPNKAAHVTQNQAESCDVVDGVVLYDKKYVLLNTLAVKNGSATLVAGSDYEAAHEDDGSVAITLLSTAAKEASSLTVSSTSLKPSGVTAADIVGGVDAATGKETGLELIRQIYPTLGMVPGLILAPGWSHTPTVAAALQAKTENINGNFNCSCLLDISADSDGAVVYTSVKGAKEALGASSAHAAALWPMVAVGEKKYYFSAMFAALTAYTDANNADVPYESPSNKDLRITATVLKDGTTVALDQQQANDVLNANRLVFESGWRSQTNQLASYADRWSPENPASNIPRVNAVGREEYSSRVIEDGSFLRLKNVSLGYTLPSRSLRKAGISQMRVYVSADNIWTLTGYSGPDPEVSTRNSVLTPGFDWSAYPRAFGFTAGVNLTF